MCRQRTEKLVTRWGGGEGGRGILYPLTPTCQTPGASLYNTTLRHPPFTRTSTVNPDEERQDDHQSMFQEGDAS